MGTLKGVGRLYMQAVVDTCSSYAFAKLYTSKIAGRAADMMNDRVVPFFSKERISINAVLTDNCKEYKGKPEEHPYELFLALNDIEHRFTKVGTPRTNGFVERFNRTILDEFFREAFRKKLYPSVEELQKDLDKWLEHYNKERPHKGYRNQGRRPSETFALGKKEIAKHQKQKGAEKEVKKAA